jgi:hypothetical protein
MGLRTRDVLREWDRRDKRERDAWLAALRPEPKDKPIGDDSCWNCGQEIWWDEVRDHEGCCPCCGQYLPNGDD